MKATDVKTAFDDDVLIDGVEPNFDYPTRAWDCKCGRVVERYRGMDDILCDCGQWFNSFGQELRQDWFDNPSNYDDSISDMEGYEREQLAKDLEVEHTEKEIWE